jgi:hypothetical protein
MIAFIKVLLHYIYKHVQMKEIWCYHRKDCMSKIYKEFNCAKYSFILPYE